MPEGDLVEWFGSLPAFTQIFFGLFLLLMALPIATLIVFQLVDSLRSLLSSAAKDGDGKPGKRKRK